MYNHCPICKRPKGSAVSHREDCCRLRYERELARALAAERERDDARRLAGILADAWQGRVVVVGDVEAAVDAVPEEWRP